MKNQSPQEFRFHVPWYSYVLRTMLGVLLVFAIYTVAGARAAAWTGLAVTATLTWVFHRYAFLSADGYLRLTDTHLIVLDKPDGPDMVPLSAIEELWVHSGGRVSPSRWLSLCCTTVRGERWRHIRTFGLKSPVSIAVSIARAAGLQWQPVPFLCPIRYRRNDVETSNRR